MYISYDEVKQPKYTVQGWRFEGFILRNFKKISIKINNQFLTALLPVL